MNRTVKTGKVGGNADYAYVADRLKQFREDCPNGLIETSPTIREDGQLMFTARILKDKKKPESAEATGHALGKNSGAKAFEKLETQAVGRALALLGYLASGEIASADEMQDFYEYRDAQVQMAIDLLTGSESIDELKSNFMSLGSLMAEKSVVEAKDRRKAELNESR